MCLGIPGKVLELGEEHGLQMGKVDFGGICRWICIDHVPDVAIGEFVLVHVGFALSKLDEEEARRIFALLEGTGELEELEHEEP